MPDEPDIAGVAKALFTKGFGGIIRIELIDEPFALWVDGRQDVPTVSVDPPSGVGHGFCLWRLESEDVRQFLTTARKRLMSGIISGRVRISGDMAVMARLELAHE